MATKKKTAVKKAAVAEPKSPVPVRFVIAGAPGVPVRLSISWKGSSDALLITAGETVNLAPGSYSVLGDWSPNWDRRIFGGYVYSTPPLSVDCVVVVPAGGGDVAVPSKMRCFALEFGEDCESYRVRGYDGVMSPLKVPCFISGGWGFPSLDLTAIPTPESGRVAKTYKLVTLDLAVKPGNTLVEAGMTYRFSPEPKVEE